MTSVHREAFFHSKIILWIKEGRIELFMFILQSIDGFINFLRKKECDENLKYLHS